MASVKKGNTKPEMALRRALHREGFRYRLHDKRLPGRPDLVLPRHRAAIFVHGCFWHRHEGCAASTTPASNVEFWTAKFADNRARDARSLESITELGWRVAVVWECALKRGTLDLTISALKSWLPDRSNFLQLPQEIAT
jgi:DNA mismatch endonuclease (patch repair protein)